MAERHAILLAALAAIFPLLLHAQDPLPLTEEDLRIASSGRTFRQGIMVMPLPILSYNSDLGFQFGAGAELYDYGRQPSIYPKYFHYLHLEASHYTKGQTFLNAEYDSSFLIPRVRFTATLSWQNDPLWQFYGFNGLSAYDETLDRHDGVAFYSYHRKMLRAVTAFRGKIGGRFGWMASASLRYVASSDLDFGGYDSANTLFHQYLAGGIIQDSELSGITAEALCGVSFDSRDSEKDPLRGVWAEAFISGAPDFSGADCSYLRASLRWRHYLTPGPDWLTLAYHLGYQGTVAGRAPFYMLPNISTIQIRQSCSEGLGGINTVRGVLSNRLVGDSCAWANFELRLRVLNFSLAGMDIVAGMNPFLDLGYIIRPVRPGAMAENLKISVEELYSRSRVLHPSAGLGLKLCIDTNTMLSIEWGKPFRPGDGNSSLYFAMNYIF